MEVLTLNPYVTVAYAAKAHFYLGSCHDAAYMQLSILSIRQHMRMERRPHCITVCSREESMLTSSQLLSVG